MLAVVHLERIFFGYIAITVALIIAYSAQIIYEGTEFVEVLDMSPFILLMMALWPLYLAGFALDALRVLVS